MVSRKYFSNHVRSSSHKSKTLTSKHNFENVTVLNTAFGSRVVTYQITSPLQSSTTLQTPEQFFDTVKDTISRLINESIKDLTIIKVNFLIHADFVQETKDLHNTFDFQTSNFTICRGDDLDPYFKLLGETIKNKMSEFEKKDSGWSFKSVRHLEMNINKFNPLRGSSYVKLPKDIQNKKAVINVQNNDHECLKWALLSALYPAQRHVDRVSSYKKHQNKLNFDNVPFPVKLKDIDKVENNNNISINVFGLEYDEVSKKNTVVGPLYFTKNRRENHINLLYVSNGMNGHYCYIKNLSRLVSKQLTGGARSLFICDGCLLHFSCKERLNNHQKFDCSHVFTELPNPSKTKRGWFGNNERSDKIRFNNYERQMRVPFVVYADTEAFLKPVAGCDPDPSKSHTTNIQEHEIYSYGYYIKCSYDDSLSTYKTYTGPDCTTNFMENLCRDVSEIHKRNCIRKPPVPLKDWQEADVLQTKTCHICSKDLNSESTLDFDWNTGLFRGVAHPLCSSKFRAPYFIPVFLHNLSNYDAHFIVRSLHLKEGDIEIIPQNKEKYISFSKKLNIDGHNVHLRFLDSFKFMNSSLDSLSKNLQVDQLRELKKQVPSEEDFKRLIRKGIFPYEFIKSYSSLNTTSLPNQSDFYSSLSESHVSDEDYKHAQDVWQHFQCRNMLDYANLYLKTDVLLLADVFENFRDVCLKTYGLDPAHYYTAPGLSWDAMLKCSKIELDLMTDFDMIAFIKSGIRGGVSVCSNRYAKANNEYLHDYNSKARKSFLTYLDANNLYGWAMSQFLPYGYFRWVDTKVNFQVSSTSDTGYILEVDLDYPDNLHDLHSDLPLCPENICTGGSKQPKLVPNLNNKRKYVIHYRNLMQCLEKGMKLVKVHRVLEFKQGPWLQKYIDLNTQLRTQAKSDFEKDFYKLMNNAIFGKTMENIEKRVNVKLLTHWENRGKVQGVQSLIARPNFHSLSIFSENLVAVQLNKTKLLYNKPIYIGFCILEISKTLMYDFHYNYIKKKYDQNAKLLYTDTDSFIYQIFTDNFYDDIRPDLEKYFDTSDYPVNNIFNFPNINKKKIGFFKDENNGRIFKEFVGLRSKMYAIQVENQVIAKAKGVNKSVTKKMKIDDYRSCLLNKSVQLAEMYRFRSIKHVVFTQKINKVSLSDNDTKRCILPNSTDTLAWGHYSIRNN